MRQRGAASRRDAATVRNEAGRDAFAIGDELAADREGILHAGLRAALFISRCRSRDQRSGKNGKRKRRLDFHSTLQEKATSPIGRGGLV